VSFVHGKDAVFTLDDSGGTPRAVRIYLNAVNGLPGARTLSEVTAFGDGGVKNIPSLANVPFSIGGHYDATASTGIATVLNGLRTTTATSTFEYGPAGSASGAIKITGECWMTEYTIDAEVSNRVPIAASFQVDGIPTLGTFS
jgi:hypothetical protein